MDNPPERNKKKWYLDIQRVPCARSALIYGILGGGVSGIVYFLRSGVIRRSCDLAIGGFVLISLFSWEFCRYQRAKVRAELKKTIDILNKLNSEEQQIDSNIVKT